MEQALPGWVKALLKIDKEYKAQRGVVLIVLGISLAAALLFYLIDASPSLMLPLAFSLVIAILIALRGYLRLAGIIGTLVALLVFTRLIFANLGIHDTAILGLPAIIIAASMLNGRLGTLIYAAISLLIIAVLGLAQVNGWVPNPTTIQNTPIDYVVVCVMIIVTAALQWAVIKRLQESAGRTQQAYLDLQKTENALRQSGQRYRIISEVSSDYAFSSVVARDGAVTTDWVAGAFETISGYTTEEFLARGGWRSTIHPDDLAQDDRDMAALMANQKVVSEIRIIARDGTIRWMRVFAQPIWDADEDRLVGIYGAVQNITTEKLIQNSLVESEERYRTFIAQSTEAIRRYDLDEPIPIDLPEDEQVRRMLAGMYIAECNDAFAQMYGLADASQLVGKTLADMHLENDPANLASLHDFVRSGYRVKDAESHETDFQGRERFYLVNTIGIVENGLLIRAWGLQRDITEQKLAEEQIRNLNALLELRVVQRTAQLETANKDLDSFSYSVSHDLRAPLRGIHGFGEILLQDFGAQLEPQARSFVEKIVNSAREMNEMFDSLLELSRTGRGELRVSQVDLSEMAVSVLEGLQKNEPARSVAWQVTPGLFACADQTLIRNVLENLLGNAWKYTSKKTGARITFGIEQAGGEMTYYVRDNGAGFDMQFAGNLFGTFQRLHRAEEFPGNGIGLATVRRIIQRHGGRIWADAAVGQGATFHFTLPDGQE